MDFLSFSARFVMGAGYSRYRGMATVLTARIIAAPDAAGATQSCRYSKFLAGAASFEAET